MNDKYFDCWYTLKLFLKNYRNEHAQNYDGENKEIGYGRYCVALSIDDILEKMDEIEKKYV